MHNWRKHQSRLITVADLMRANTAIKTVLAHVTPGGGKSALPLIFAHHLIPRRGDKIAWITPRDNLRTQGESSFLDKTFRSLLGHGHEIIATTNEVDPSRGTAGFITTYDSIRADKSNHHLLDEFRRHRYLLVLDEPQHVAEGSDTHKALQPFWDFSSAQLLMSGGLMRSDNQRVAFLPYLPMTADRKYHVDLTNNESRYVISYSLRDALEERAIIPMWFELVDGEASWDKDGDEFDVDNVSLVKRDQAGDAIHTVLRTGFAKHLLDKTIEHWRAHKRFNKRGLLLVVAPSIALARKYLGWLKALNIKADIATSDQSKQAQDNIQLFKAGKLDALVTVAMAYEGMDVPPITHIACLTHIRARPWIEQMLARATRYDKKASPWEHQRAWIFAPDDPLFNDIMNEMKEVQAPFVVDTIEKCSPSERDANQRKDSATTPIASSAHSSRGAGLNPDEVIGKDDYQRFTDALRESSLFGIATPHQLKTAFDNFNSPRQPQQEDDPESTPSQRIDKLRTQIEAWIRANFYDGEGALMGEIGKSIIKRYKKSRTLMNERELQLVWDERNIWSAGFERVQRHETAY